MIEKPFLLRDIWYFAMPGQQLKPGTVVAKTFLGEPIVLGRRRDGAVFALRDICPHRAVPLSQGQFDGEQVRCCYHGWRFDSSGSCTEIPSLTADRALDLSRFRVRSYPLREVQGNLWIFMASSEKQNDQADLIDIPLIPNIGNQPCQMIDTVQMPGAIDHVLLGLIDPAHVPNVHQVWWWRSRGALHEKAKAFEPSPYGFTMSRHKLQRTTLGYRLMGGTPEVEIIFRLPGIRTEVVMTEQHTLCNMTTLTPISETETEFNNLLYWTVPWFTLLKPFLRPFVKAFIEQDRAVMVKQQAGLKYNPPLMLVQDADTQAKWYFQLKTEFARAASEGRPFINPLKAQVLRWRS